jgi:hypothetical protein
MTPVSVSILEHEHARTPRCRTKTEGGGGKNIYKNSHVETLFRMLTRQADRYAIAQAVSRRLPTAPARVRAQSGHVGFVVHESGSAAGFLRVLRFPLPIIIPPNSPSS